VFADFLFANVYLNPGELSMLVYVEAPGASLNTFTFKPSERPPSSYTAALAYRSGVASLTGLGDAKQPLGFIQNLGRAGSGLTFGVVGARGPANGAHSLFRALSRFRSRSRSPWGTRRPRSCRWRPPRASGRPWTCPWSWRPEATGCGSRGTRMGGTPCRWTRSRSCRGRAQRPRPAVSTKEEAPPDRYYI